MGNLRIALAPYLANKEVLSEAIVTTTALGLLLLVCPYYALFGRARAPARSHRSATQGQPLRVERVRSSARLPERPSSHTLGYTLYSAEERTVAPGAHTAVRTGLRIGVPEGHVGLLVTVRHAGSFADFQVMPSLLHPDSLQEVALTVTNCGVATHAVETGDPIAHLTLLCAAAPPIDLSRIDFPKRRFVVVNRIGRIVWCVLANYASTAWHNLLYTWRTLFASRTEPPTQENTLPLGTHNAPTPAIPSVKETKETVAKNAVEPKASKSASRNTPTHDKNVVEQLLVSDDIFEWNNGRIVTIDDKDTQSGSRYASPERRHRGGRLNASTPSSATASSTSSYG